MSDAQQSGWPRQGIGPGTEADVYRCGRTMERAFFDDPVLRYLLPDDEQYATVAPIVCRNVVRRSLAAEGLWCSPDGVAFASWHPPLDEAAPDRDYEVEEFDEQLIERERFAALREALTANRPADPHWYLQVLATHPDWQGQGYGATLMSVVFAIADRDQVPCYLETETVDLVAYYRRHGFEIRTEWDVALDGPHMWGMLRPPHPTD